MKVAPSANRRRAGRRLRGRTRGCAAIFCLGLAILCRPPLWPPATAWAADWPQVQGGPQRWGYSPEKLDVPLQDVWARAFSSEKLHHEVQPVIGGGRLFVGTAMGTLYAIRAEDGQSCWTFTADGPILGSAGVEKGKVFFGCLTGRVYALDAATGKPLWTFENGHRTGFSAAVLLAEGKVFVADRGGSCYALDQTDGRKVWETHVGAPILMSSAYDNGRIFVAATDMRVRALDAGSGRILWTSAPLPGESFNSRWPVAYKGYVLVRSYMVSSGNVSVRFKPLSGPLPAEEIAKQDLAVEELLKQPHLRSLFALSQETGKEEFILPHWNTNTHNGTTCAPCVDGDGLLIVPVNIEPWPGAWGRLDMDKRRVVELLIEARSLAGRSPRLAGTGNGDENLDVSAAGPLVFTFHMQEANAHYTGVFHLGRREWTRVQPYGPRMDGGLWWDNNQSREGTPPAIAGGMIFHNKYGIVNARKATVTP